MAKKIWLIVALLLVAVFAFSGCTTKESYDFTALQGDTSGAVSSNGGIAVVKGNYVYYINGALKSYTSDNTFGKNVKASIVRVPLISFEQAGDSLNSAEIIDSRAEIIVPKMFYSANTTDKGINGIYIYNDRLYYVTPDTTLDKNGFPQTGHLALKSCKLDGTDTQHHYVFDALNYQVALMSDGGDVYAVYLKGSTLYSIRLTSEAGEQVEVANDVASVKFDVDNASVFYLNKTNDICFYSVGGKSKVLVDNPTVEGDTTSTVTYAIVNVYDGVLYYSAKSDYVISKDTLGVYSVTATGTRAKLMTRVEANIYCYDGKVLISSGSGESYNVVEYNPATNNTQEIVKSTKSITMDKVVGNMLYYTINGEYLRTDFNKINNPDKLITKTLLSNYATYDIVGDYVVFFDGTYNEKNLVYLVRISKIDGKAESKPINYHLPVPVVDEDKTEDKTEDK